MTNLFTGFTQETLDFLWGLRLCNEKPWFEAHKSDYTTTLARPMRELGGDVYAAIHKAFPDENLVLRVARIYRDARRLFGRGPYKDSLWLTLERSSDAWEGSPAFWFELYADKFCYGLGYYDAPALVMAKFRARLDRDPKPFLKTLRPFAKHKQLRLETDPYKRPKGDLSPTLNPWYNSKSFSVIAALPNDERLFSPALAEELTTAFRDLMPLYRYLVSLSGDPDPRGAVSAE